MLASDDDLDQGQEEPDKQEDNVEVRKQLGMVLEGGSLLRSLHNIVCISA